MNIKVKAHICNIARAVAYITKSTGISYPLRFYWELLLNLQVSNSLRARCTGSLAVLLIQHHDGQRGSNHQDTALLSLSFHRLRLSENTNLRLLLCHSPGNGRKNIKKSSSSPKDQTWWKRKANCQTTFQSAPERLSTWERLPRLAQGAALPCSSRRHSRG